MHYSSKHLSLRIFIFVSALVPCLAFAQANYRPGYAVNLKGDTLKGYINYKDWNFNPNIIEFKPALSGNKQSFTVHNIRLFAIEGLATYQRSFCSISMDATDPSRVSTGRDTAFKTDTVFLKVLQRGALVTFYAYADELKRRLYISSPSSPNPAELAYHIYINPNDSKTIIDDGYKKTLFALAAQANVVNAKLSRLLQDADYNQDALMPVVSQINGISNADFEKHHGEQLKMSRYIFLGANIASTSSSGSSGYTVGGGTASTSVLPAAGIGLNFDPSPVGGRIEFRADLSVNPARHSAVYGLKVSPYGTARATYNQTGIFLCPQVIFDLYKSENVNVHLGAGIGLSYSIYSNQHFQSQSSPGNPLFPAKPFDFNAINNAFLFKAGVTIAHKWEVYFDYFTSTSTTGGDYFFLANQTKQIGLGYFFN